MITLLNDFLQFKPRLNQFIEANQKKREQRHDGNIQYNFDHHGRKD
jgi:hypothetical protein